MYNVVEPQEDRVWTVLCGLLIATLWLLVAVQRLRTPWNDAFVHRVVKQYFPHLPFRMHSFLIFFFYMKCVRERVLVKIHFVRQTYKKVYILYNKSVYSVQIRVFTYFSSVVKMVREK